MSNVNLDREQLALAKELVDRIDDGSYFEDGKNWYLDRYVYPVIERSTFVVITAISLITSITAIYVLINFLPLTAPVPVPVKIHDMAKEYVTIHLVGRREDDPNQALVKELLTRYVKAREAYEFEKLESASNIIKRFSSQEILKGYKSYISIRNSDSPILRYREHTKKFVIVDKWSYRIAGNETNPELPPNTHRAVVNIETNEINVLGEKKERWRVEIEFNFSGITFVKKEQKFLPIDFYVTNYGISNIEQ